MSYEQIKSESLKNLLEVVEHLNAAGWKVSKSAVYRHRTQGKIGPQADGSFVVADVERYARDWLKRMDGSGGRSKVEPADQGDKRQAEIRKLKAQAEIAEIKAGHMRGEYQPTESVDRENAAKAAQLKSFIENTVRKYTGDSLSLGKGDLNYTPDTIEFWLNKFEIGLSEFAKPVEWDVPLYVSELKNI